MMASCLSLDAMQGLASPPPTSASALPVIPKRSSVRIPPRNPNPASPLPPLQSRSRSCIRSSPLFCILGQQQQEKKQQKQQQQQQPNASFGVVGTVTAITWKELVMESDIPVVVDFWAPWCGPCRMIEPLVDELAMQYAGKIKCLKLNTDECPQIATEYGIRSIPTLMVFVQGQKRETVIGAVPKQTLITKLEKFLT